MSSIHGGGIRRIHYALKKELSSLGRKKEEITLTMSRKRMNLTAIGAILQSGKKVV